MLVKAIEGGILISVNSPKGNKSKQTGQHQARKAKQIGCHIAPLIAQVTQLDAQDIVDLSTVDHGQATFSSPHFYIVYDDDSVTIKVLRGTIETPTIPNGPSIVPVRSNHFSITEERDPVAWNLFYVYGSKLDVEIGMTYLNGVLSFTTSGDHYRLPIPACDLWSFIKSKYQFGPIETTSNHYLPPVLQMDAKAAARFEQRFRKAISKWKL